MKYYTRFGISKKGISKFQTKARLRDEKKRDDDLIIPDNDAQP